MNESASKTMTPAAYTPASQIASRSRSNDAYAWSGAVAVNRAYANNGLNQHTQSGSIALSYDGRGNLTSSGATTYGYSAENRLASVFDSGGWRLLSYDALGRLARTNGSASTYFEYSGSEAIREFDGATGAVLRRYACPEPVEGSTAPAPTNR